MKKENEYAIFEYEKCDKDLMDGLSNYLDENAHIAFEFFNVQHSADEKVRIEIIPTKKEFDEKYIKDRNYPADYKVPGWLIGTSIFKERKIVYLSLHDYKNASHQMSNAPFDEAFAYYKKTIVHEFVHFVHGLYKEKNKTGDTIRCFGEGIACYLSGQKDGMDMEFTASYDDLFSGNTSYNQYYLITKYLVEHYDKDFVLKVLSDKDTAINLLQTELYDKAKEFYSKKQEL